MLPPQLFKKHRYDDECNLGEEEGFTNQFTANPLQLPGERTIICISHSQNTFDKDFVLGSSEPLETSLAQAITDPMLKNWYQSLHNATHHQPIQWDYIDQVVIVNLDSRPDRLAHIQQELAFLNFPAQRSPALRRPLPLTARLVAASPICRRCNWHSVTAGKTTCYLKTIA